MAIASFSVRGASRNAHKELLVTSGTGRLSSMPCSLLPVHELPWRWKRATTYLAKTTSSLGA
jgi:hypothetical protein